MFLCNFTLVSLVSLVVHLHVFRSRSNNNSCVIQLGCLLLLSVEDHGEAKIFIPEFFHLSHAEVTCGEFGLKNSKLVFQVIIATTVKAIKLLSFSSNQMLQAASDHCVPVSPLLYVLSFFLFVPSIICLLLPLLNPFCRRLITKM